MNAKNQFRKNKDDPKVFKSRVAKELLESFSVEPVKAADIKAAEELITSIDFDLYEETNHCQILTGVEIRNLPTIVNGLAMRFELSEEVTESILDSEYANHNDKVVREFRFQLGDAGHMRYGRVAAIKRGEVIDLAYSFYTIDFKFSAKRIEETKNEKIFLWNVSNVNVTKEERNITTQEKNLLLGLLRHKALEAFKQEYPFILQDSESASPAHSVELLQKNTRNFYQRKLENGCCPFM